MEKSPHTRAAAPCQAMTRRSFATKGAVFLTAVVGGIGLNRAFAQMKKSTQKVVKYQDTPKDNRKCADCAFFIAKDNTCKVVEGTVKPEGWCLRWAKKSA